MERTSWSGLRGLLLARVYLYQVCIVRHIVCLQNDHKPMMKQVQEALHQLHAHDKKKQAGDMAEAQRDAIQHKLSYPETHIHLRPLPE